MSWFADLAGKAENLLTNIDEQTGVALRNQNMSRSRKYERQTSAAHHESVWSPKRRPTPTPRPLKKSITESKPIHLPPNRNTSPMSHFSTSSTQENFKSSAKGRRPSTKNINNLDNVPTRNMVGDFSDTHRLKGRRCPADHLDLMDSEDFTYTIENLEVENAMLKNEMNVLNKEMTALLDRLNITGTELDQKNTKLKNTEEQYAKLDLQKEELKSKLDEATLKVKSIAELEAKIKELCDKNAELEDMLLRVNETHNESTSAHKKIEAELRHASNTIHELQDNLAKSNDECLRLEKDWASYKCRVRSMLIAKDKEILSLQQCAFTEDKASLMEQIEQLKQEREVLSDAVQRVRGEFEDMKQYMDTMELKHASAERVMFALRDALRDERAARNRAEAQCGAVSKELKAIQIETGQTIASLRTALRDKHEELNLATKETVSSARSIDTSALNVADYDVSEMNFDSEKVYQLTQKLISKQGKLESMLAENNTLKIQLEKFENKYKTEQKELRTNAESVVHCQDRLRVVNKSSIALQLSRKLGYITRTHPLLCVVILVYMVSLHLWVFTVILSRTPDSEPASKY